MASETSNFSNDTNDFEIGKIVFQKFEILAFISEGANGRVYKARDILRDAVVAVKVLISATSDDKSLIRFQGEAKAISKMKHPNVAKVYDFGLVEGVPYLSMEYVEGQSLNSILETQGSLPLVIALEVFIQICEALVHAHKHGIIHRDIKPANIILSKEKDGSCRVTVIDFGVAKNIDLCSSQQLMITGTGNIVGSPLYMSPEQGRGELVTAKSDIYSLGCVMWRCLVGEPPFMGETVMQTIWHHIHTPPGKIAPNNNSAFPSKLTDLVNDLLSKLPSERPDLKTTVLPTLSQLLADELKKPKKEDQTYTADDGTTSGAPTKSRKEKLFQTIGPFVLAMFVLSVFVFMIGSPFGHRPSQPSVSRSNDASLRLPAASADSVETTMDQLIESRPDHPLRANLMDEAKQANSDKDYSQVLRKYQDGLKLAERHAGAHSESAATFHQLIGDVEVNLKRPELASQSYERALQIFEKAKDFDSALVCLDKLASIFADSNKRKESHYNSRALKLAEKLNGEISLDVANRNLKIGDRYRESSLLAKASRAYKQSYDITNKLCGATSKELAYVMIRTGEMHRLANEMGTAKSVLEKARSTLTTSPVSRSDQQYAGIASVGLAAIGFQLKQFKQALNENSKAIEYYKLAKSSTMSMSDVYQQRAAIYSSMGETKAAQAALETSKKLHAQANARLDTTKTRR